MRTARISASDGGKAEGIVFLPAHQLGPQTVRFVASASMFLNHKRLCLFFFWALIVQLLPLSTTRAAAAVEAPRPDLCQQTWFRAEWQSMWHIQQTEMFRLNVSAAQKSPW